MKNHTKDINIKNHTKDINVHNHIEDEKLSQEIQEVDAPFFGPESHTMNVSVATQCKSSDAGLVFSHVFFWIKNNKIRGVNQISGRTWMYETILHMQKFLPYLSDMQIKRALTSLVQHGYLLKANYNKNKFDHTSWYALANEEWINSEIYLVMEIEK